MKLLTIENWKYGLDSRRTLLTSNPGSLAVLNNGHINEGAEAEGRKAYVPLAHPLPRAVLLANGELLNAYDLVATSTGLFTFGSADSSSNVVATSAPYVFPTGVTYQRLQHPLRYLSSVFSGFITGWNVIPEMTSVVVARAFGDSPFVVATFSTGQFTTATGATVNVLARTFIFWQGQPLWQQFLGENLIHDVLGAGSTSTALLILGSLLANYFPQYFPATSGFSSTTTAQFLTGPTAGSVVITGPIGTPFVVTESDTNTTTGLITVSNQQVATGPVVGIGPTFTFYIVSGNSGQVTSITPSTGSDLLNGTPVPFATSKLITAQNVAAGINANTGTTGFSAQASLVPGIGGGIAQVTITAPVGTTWNTKTSAIVVTSTLHVANTSTAAGTTAGTLTSTAFTGGIDPSNGASQVTFITFNFLGGTWDDAATYTLILTYNSVSYTMAFGNIGGVSPTALQALGNKQYVSAGRVFYFSKINDAFRWEQQDTGAGFIQVSDVNSAPTNIVALAVYQGRLAVFSRWNIQTWAVDANPANYAQVQNFQNIGTFARDSVVSLGDLDVLFLSDTGVRSLRVRDSSNNAFVADLGSPIDELILASLLAGSASSNAAAYGVMEPTSNRFWLYLNGVIYVLSYFPNLKILAWATYTPQYSAGDGAFTTFALVKFQIFAGQVYHLDSNANVAVYGGTNNNTFDGSQVTLQTPWMDDKQPSTVKTLQGIDVDISGQWAVLASCDPITDGTGLEPVITNGSPTTANELTDSTFDMQRIPVQGMGTHMQLKLVSTVANTGLVTCGGVVFKYKEGNIR